MFEDEKCLIGSPCYHCDSERCSFYKLKSSSRVDDQDEKEKKYERTIEEPENRK